MRTARGCAPHPALSYFHDIMKHVHRNDAIRNIAIIAHVDHGKTTLVDHMFRQSGTFRENQDVAERVMDSMDLERERGITIAAKNCSVRWKGTKINILDTPGHADFGGEVERALVMVDGAILLVDASEGPLPQTRFVLNKALEAGKRIIVVVNKIDRQDARPEEVLQMIYDLFIDLDADDEQIAFPVLYAIGKQGIARRALDDDDGDLAVLFETILEEIPGPAHEPQAPFQMLVSDLDYSDYLGRLAIGRVFHGRVRRNDALACIGENGEARALRVSNIQVYEGIGLRDADEVEPGDIAILAGIEDVHIGDTICTLDRPTALPRIMVDEPTISMHFAINSSPFSGREGKHVQSAKLRERLQREMLSNVALMVEDGETPDSFVVKGRGEFQMVILIETMRREGYEMSVGRPRVIFRERHGRLQEPIEHLVISCDEAFTGIVTEKVSQRKGRMLNLANHGTGRVQIEFSIPSRGLIGYRSEFLTDTKGTGMMHSYLEGYGDHRGDFPTRLTGSIVADRPGDATGHALFNLEPRGVMFIEPGTALYEGMIVGEHNRDADIDVNACKPKKLTNMRASTKDDAISLTPVTPMTLERAIEFIRDDELVEVTPKSIRLRKILLPATDRHRARAIAFVEKQ
jgi:GTP-binding protein